MKPTNGRALAKAAGFARKGVALEKQVQIEGRPML